MNAFRFETPLFFWLLAPLFAAEIYALWRLKRARPSFLFSTTFELENIRPTFEQRLKRWFPAVYLVGATLIVVALARPQLGVVESKIRGEGIAIAMCVDRSGSMAALDCFDARGRRVDRLTAVKSVFKDFIAGSAELPGRPNDLIALIAFGGFVDTRSPLTLDRASLLETLDKIETPKPLYDARGNVVRTQVIDEESGTAIGDALAASVERIKDAPTKTKIVVLLSDGMQTTGALTPEEGVKVANAYGVKVYTIGFGASGPTPFPTTLPNGETAITTQILEFNDAALKTIANATGGRYFYASDVDALKQVCEEIDRLERVEFESGSYAEYRDIYVVFAALGIATLSTLAFLCATRFRTFP
ncbi:MAG: VWA domain-containing protein [Thermoguttaceae bacterium]|nr:VWA domain-containing protein [Thermoguttaceae bacterium]